MKNHSKLLKSTIAVLSFLYFFFTVNISSSRAQNSMTLATPSAEATVSADPYVLFWPMVAGRTVGDRLYFLKTAKEKIVGMFIFKTSKKVEYQISLATKRLLEAEKLTKENEKDKALETVNIAKTHLEKAKVELDSAKNSKERNVESVNKLSNISVFLPQLKAMSDQSVAAVLDQITTLTQELRGRLQ